MTPRTFGMGAASSALGRRPGSAGNCPLAGQWRRRSHSAEQRQRAAPAVLPAAIIGAALVVFAGTLNAATTFGLLSTGELYSSPDGGTNWTITSTLPIRDAVALVARSSSSQLLMVSATGSFFRSSDGGVSWSAVNAIPASDVTALESYSGHLLVITQSGSVYSSTNEGASFTAVGAITAPDVVGAARQGGASFALARSGGVYRSDDDGATWTAVGALTTSEAVAIAGFNGKLWALTASGDLARSDDLGGTWIFTSTLSQVGMTALTSTESELLASTAAGEVAATATGTSWTWRGAIGQLTVRALGTNIPTVTGVESPERRAHFQLAAPWPNPASSAVQLALELEREGRVTLDVYDAIGRRIARPITGQRLPVGRNVLSWRPQELAGGSYFLRVQVGDRQQTRRLMWLGNRP